MAQSVYNLMYIQKSCKGNANVKNTYNTYHFVLNTVVNCLLYLFK